MRIRNTGKSFKRLNLFPFFQLPVPPEYQRHHGQVGRRSVEVLLQRGHLPHAGDGHRAGGGGRTGQHHVRHHAMRAFTLAQVSCRNKFMC
jgi:hypothetical protein